MTEKTYPMTITPLEDVKIQRDKNGRSYLRFKATAASGNGISDRTVRVFGQNVRAMKPHLAKGKSIKGRVAFDSFKDEAGKHQQSMRLVAVQ